MIEREFVKNEAIKAIKDALSENSETNSDYVSTMIHDAIRLKCGKEIHVKHYKEIDAMIKEELEALEFRGMIIERRYYEAGNNFSQF